MRQQQAGTIFAGLGLTAIMMAALLLPGLSKIKKSPSPDDPFGPLIPTQNPLFLEDQLATRRISRVARGLDDDWDHLKNKYGQVRPFIPRQSPVLSEDDVLRYITAYETFIKERRHLMRNVLSETPGVFQVIAFTGMIYQFYDVQRVRGLVAAGITEEEFTWIRERIMEAALYCVQYKLDHDPMPAEEKKWMEEELRENLYLATGIKEILNGEIQIFHREKLRLDKVPQTNIALFLKYYKRINWSGVHFNKYPHIVTFDELAILEAARNNPP